MKIEMKCLFPSLSAIYPSLVSSFLLLPPSLSLSPPCIYLSHQILSSASTNILDKYVISEGFRGTNSIPSPMKNSKEFFLPINSFLRVMDYENDFISQNEKCLNLA